MYRIILLVFVSFIFLISLFTTIIVFAIGLITLEFFIRTWEFVIVDKFILKKINKNSI